MTMNTTGRPTRPNESASSAPDTLTGARGLLQDEPLIFELDGWKKTGGCRWIQKVISRA